LQQSGRNTMPLQKTSAQRNEPLKAEEKSLSDRNVHAGR
jgi:hypothetical protein